MNKEIQTGEVAVTVYEDHFNRRIRIDDYAGPVQEVLKVIRRQISGWVEKLIVKSREEDVPYYLSQGFSNEGFIRGYFSGDDMYFVVKYFSAGREISKKWHEEQSIIEKIIKSNNAMKAYPRAEVEVVNDSQADTLAQLYNEIFQIYPTPLGDTNHIRKTMKEGTIYLCIREQGRIVSAASAEINRKYKNAELTDCATVGQVQGKGHMKFLLSALEEKLRNDGITCCYTIARAESYGMNKAFFQSGYTYGGRLINNCYIYSGLEDMNVWYK